MNRFVSNDVVITEKELINEIINLKEKIRELDSVKRNQRKIINLFKSLAPQYTQAMFLTDIDGKIIYANFEFTELLGYSMFDLRRMTIRSITPMNLHQNELGILKEELSNSKTIPGRFAEFIKINGDHIKAEVDVIAIFDERENFDGILRVVKTLI